MITNPVDPLAPLERAFDRFDADYDRRQEKERKERQDRLERKKEQLKKEEKEKQEKEEKQEQEQVNLIKTKDGMSYADRKIQNQVNSINYDMVRKQNNSKQRKARVDQVNWIEGNRMIQALDDEISNTMKKKSWKCMDMCFRWILVKNYLETVKSQGISVGEKDIDEVKKQLQNKTLNVVYDKSTQTIKTLNFKTETDNFI